MTARTPEEEARDAYETALLDIARADPGHRPTVSEAVITRFASALRSRAAVAEAAEAFAEADEAYQAFHAGPPPSRVVTNEHDIEQFRRERDDHDQRGQELDRAVSEARRKYRSAVAARRGT